MSGAAGSSDSQSNEPTELILYVRPPAWGLPSISVPCIQAEAYLRLAKASYAVQHCSTSSKSPVGQVPALERRSDLAVSEPSPSSEYAAAQAVIAFTKKQRPVNGAGRVLDLDAHLSAAQHAELVAYGTLIEAKLNLAVTASTWCEDVGFREYKKVGMCCPCGPERLGSCCFRAHAHACMETVAAPLLHMRCTSHALPSS